MIVQTWRIWYMTTFTYAKNLIDQPHNFIGRLTTWIWSKIFTLFTFNVTRCTNHKIIFLCDFNIWIGLIIHKHDIVRRHMLLN